LREIISRGTRTKTLAIFVGIVFLGFSLRELIPEYRVDMFPVMWQAERKNKRIISVSDFKAILLSQNSPSK